MNISMQEAAVAWGQGKEVEWSNEYQFGGQWQPVKADGFYFNSSVKYRLKPEPESSLTVSKLRDAYYATHGGLDVVKDYSKMSTFNKALKAVADAAVQQYVKENTK